MEEYKAIYKCRLCGEITETSVYQDDAINDICISEQLSLMNINPVNEIKSVPLAYYHPCNNGGVGFSDFLGFKLSNR